MGATAVATASFALVGCGSSSSNYCADEKSLQNNAAFAGLGTGSPDQVKAAVSSARSSLSKLRDEAPDQIKSQYSTAVNTVNGFFDALDAKGDDFTKLGSADLAAQSSADYMAATSAISSYDSASCSITSRGGGASSGGGGSATVSTGGGVTTAPTSSDTGAASSSTSTDTASASSTSS